MCACVRARVCVCGAVLFLLVFVSMAQVPHAATPVRTYVLTYLLTSFLPHSYNGVNGIPSCGNEMSQNEVLRAAWGFDGYIVSDCNAIAEYFFTNYVNYTLKKNVSYHVLMALAAGTDTNCGNFYDTYTEAAIAEGIVPIELVEQAVTRLYTKEIANGLLDPDLSPFNGLGAMDVDTPKARKIALEASQQAMILLKNEGNLLPLKKGQSVALIGPHINATEQVGFVFVLGLRSLPSPPSCTHTPKQATTRLLLSRLVTLYELWLTLRLSSHSQTITDAFDLLWGQLARVGALAAAGVYEASWCRFERSRGGVREQGDARTRAGTSENDGADIGSEEKGWHREGRHDTVR